MKRALLFLLIFLPLYLLASLYFLDKEYFLCPIRYKSDFIIRCDGRGNGFFAAERSGNRTHKGIDLYAQVGTPVLACRLGEVVAATRNHGMGNYVMIRHFGGIVTLYGHLSNIFVTKNQIVRQGQIIGSVGKTGNANYRDIQPHLHFEVRKNGVHEDPLQYLE